MIYPKIMTEDIKVEVEVKVEPHMADRDNEFTQNFEDNKKRSMNWAFTWNNYTEENVKAIEEKWMIDMPDMRCVIFGREIAPSTGTPHLQGLFVFKKLKSFKQVKEMMPKGINFSQMRKALEANIRYCEKDGKAVRIGDVPMSKEEQGKHGAKGGKAGAEYVSKYGHVWEHLIKDVKAGMSFKDAAEKYPDMHGMYPKGFREKFDLFAPRPMFDIRKKYENLFVWQTELLKLAEAKADNRGVIWVWSQAGAMGKSDTLKHLVSVLGFQPMQNAPTRDLACAWRGGSVVFDYSRDEQAGGQINYTVIEHIKNRLLFSAKYESATKMSNNFEDVHVICFSNNPPDASKLSDDRWHIYRIENDEIHSWTKQTVEGGIIQ